MHVILKKMKNIYNKEHIIYFNSNKNANLHKRPQFNHYFTRRLFEKKRIKQKKLIIKIKYVKYMPGFGRQMGDSLLSNLTV